MGFYAADYKQGKTFNIHHTNLQPPYQHAVHAPAKFPKSPPRDRILTHDTSLLRYRKSPREAITKLTATIVLVYISLTRHCPLFGTIMIDIYAELL